MSNDVISALDLQAKLMCAKVSNDPQGRYLLRENFYKKHGFGKAGSYGYGTSELAFMRWEIRRGVLNPVDDKSHRGSEWWRYVNWHFLYHGTFASLLFENGFTHEDADGATGLWLYYMREPSPRSWYAAHNASISHGYYFSKELALSETHYEQQFIKQVLIRLLYAQVLVMGEKYSLGLLGEFLANPDDNMVNELLHVPDFYPDHYPLSAADILRITYKEFALMDWLAKLFDKQIIGPHITQIFNSVSNWIKFPVLQTFVVDHAVIYPNIPNTKINES